jgi:hypothetical protein
MIKAGIGIGFDFPMSGIETLRVNQQRRRIHAMADESQDAPLERPPATSPLAVRELKTLFLLIAVFVGMIVVSLLVEGSAAWVYEAVLLGICFAAIFRARG